MPFVATPESIERQRQATLKRHARETPEQRRALTAAARATPHPINCICGVHKMMRNKAS